MISGACGGSGKQKWQNGSTRPGFGVGELAWKIRVASAYPGLNGGLVRRAWSVRVIAITLERLDIAN